MMHQRPNAFFGWDKDPLATAIVDGLSLLPKSLNVSLTELRNPTLLQNTAVWRNKYNVVHVVLTRFMQHQPNLLHLGRARLELFQTFCLPTLVQQTTKEFLWIIRADPDLHPVLKAELISILERSDESNINVILVGSNSRIDSGHFRTSEANADVSTKTIWYGSEALFREYFHAAQTKLVLETGLDADDGLARPFLEHLQRYAAQVTNMYRKASQSSWWRIWCVGRSVEWQFYGEYLNSSVGSLLTGASSKRWCLTPGLTRVSTSHHRHYKNSNGEKVGGAKSYRHLKRDGSGFFTDHYYIKGRIQECPDENRKAGTRFLPKGCFNFLVTNYTQAIRARSPTSAGMKHIQTISNGDRSTADLGRGMSSKENEHWDRVSATFGLSMSSVRASRSRVVANLPRILQDALSGQCTEGHTCKDEAKVALQKLLETVS